MSLTQRLSEFVSADVKNRGGNYLRKGAVKIVHGNQWSVTAEVAGSDIYDVELYRSENVVGAACNCPFATDHESLCKHIWATLLAAENRNYLRGNNGTLPTALELETTTEEFDDAYGYDDKEWDDEPVEWQGSSYARRAARNILKLRPQRQQKQNWQSVFAELRRSEERPPKPSWPATRELLYVIDQRATLHGQSGVAVALEYRERLKDGSWGKCKPAGLTTEQIADLRDPLDREVLSLLVGAKSDEYTASFYRFQAKSGRFDLSGLQQRIIAPRLCQTKRCYLRPIEEGSDLVPLTWDDGAPWELWLRVAQTNQGNQLGVEGVLRRSEHELPLMSARLLTRQGLVFWEDRVAPFEDHGAFPWVSLLKAQNGRFAAPFQQREELLKELMSVPRLPKLELPEEMRVEEVAVAPKPCLKVKPAEKRFASSRNTVLGELLFDYDGVLVPNQHVAGKVFQAETRRVISRDLAAEQAAAAYLGTVGFRAAKYSQWGSTPPGALELNAKKLGKAVAALTEAGWRVEADGKLYRPAGSFALKVTSGVDWFDLEGTADFGDQTAHLPQLLAALQRGDNTVPLDDGTFGILPQDWLKKYGVFAGLGKAEGEKLRFARHQVGVLDALLASQPDATCDAVFENAREQLRRFDGIATVDEPAHFIGALRGYQKDGLGWLNFLEQFRFGGCLADDMGLGKTVQVLALLEMRRQYRLSAKPENRPGPSLAVLPKSLVFNWKQEAARFTPQLRILDHTGLTRQKAGEHFSDYDLILTTYGTLRRDVVDFKDLTFDYCILDEAQAIKNADTESAKAARLIQANHRLAMSGTPVENHLGELWSLFEFLNPGMLGTAKIFRLGAGSKNPAPEIRTLLARALRPYILRRTKEQVAKDLPQKLEQTLFCELDTVQRAKYDELRNYYRQSLLSRIDQEGMNKSKMHVLEALLRLRQAACHVGLIDKLRVNESSAKLDMLLPQLEELREEGHKALVFSQFTSLLAIVRSRLDKDKVVYEYLDGKTQNRAERVERFQTDPHCPLFLISLKAGGIGLNLTAADYVFLLDPWWNPAVEAQAIDRTHRIGQTKNVFAYRLIAKDTVEEKVLELQKTKRDLADAIINADNSMIRGLERADIELLLS